MTGRLEDVREAVEELASGWRAERSQRQRRRHLEQRDFDDLAATGFLRCVAPVERGGLWEGRASGTRQVAEILRTMARADPSVALVSAMHPAVLGFWLLFDHPDEAWQRQRAAVFATAVAGEQWGTITSEPGSGGDIGRTRAVAAPAPDLEDALGGRRYRISGDKHFGSGTGVLSYMSTTALPDDGDGPTMFVVDVRDHPWERDAGMAVVAEWDGVGMAATQSHAMRLQDMPATRLAWDGPLEAVAGATGGFNACLFTAVILGVLDEAVATARVRIADRAGSLRPFEQSEWVRADMDHWLAVQAYEGALRSAASDPLPVALHVGLRAKQSVARLAEETMLRLTRVLGGGTFSRRSPFSYWFEDVRALGFLRPPWGLASDRLLDASLVDDADSST